MARELESLSGRYVVRAQHFSMVSPYCCTGNVPLSPLVGSRGSQCFSHPARRTHPMRGEVLHADETVEGAVCSGLGLGCGSAVPEAHSSSFERV